MKVIDKSEAQTHKTTDVLGSRRQNMSHRYYLHEVCFLENFVQHLISAWHILQKV